MRQSRSIGGWTRGAAAVARHLSPDGHALLELGLPALPLCCLCAAHAFVTGWRILCVSCLGNVQGLKESWGRGSACQPTPLKPLTDASALRYGLPPRRRQGLGVVSVSCDSLTLNNADRTCSCWAGLAAREEAGETG